jgi:hypothetical protein
MLKADVFSHDKVMVRRKTRRQTRRIKRQRGGSHTVDLVIARYKEDLNWLSNYKNKSFRRVIIYNKGPDMACPSLRGCEIIKLQNVGMCDHTYLYHIVHEYNNLADFTIFLPGSADLPHKEARQREIIDLAFKGMPAIYGYNVGDMRDHSRDMILDKWEVTDPDNKEAGENYSLHPASHRPFGAWVDHYLKDHPRCPYITYNGGLFSLTKEMIKKHKVPFYMRFLSQLNHKHTEAAHYMERIWGALYYPYAEGVFHQL